MSKGIGQLKFIQQSNLQFIAIKNSSTLSSSNTIYFLRWLLPFHPLLPRGETSYFEI